MAGTLPPPAERFDPVTARWLPPGGPLHDPERDGVDPAHTEPVTLVGPVPRELSGIGASPDHGADRPRSGRRWWVVLAVVVITIAVVAIGAGF